jgi:hypothetical protein
MKDELIDDNNKNRAEQSMINFFGDEKKKSGQKDKNRTERNKTVQ